MTVRQATPADLEALVPLFDGYRVFYGKPSDPYGARRFLAERMERGESTILLALDGEKALGFTQLYPSFSSVSMARIFVLNDLFVTSDARGQGVAQALLTAAAEFGRAEGAVRLALSTALDNHRAQSVYERAGWKRDTEFCVYELAL